MDLRTQLIRGVWSGRYRIIYTFRLLLVAGSWTVHISNILNLKTIDLPGSSPFTFSPPTGPIIVFPRNNLRASLTHEDSPALRLHQ